MNFLEKRDFDGDSSAVWGRASDFQGIPSYWHGTRELKIKETGNKTTADVTFAFGGKGQAEITVDGAARKLTIDYVKGPFRGRQTVTVKDGSVESEWDVTFNGIYKLAAPWNASHFRSGTRNALRRLCEGTKE